MLSAQPRLPIRIRSLARADALMDGMIHDRATASEAVERQAYLHCLVEAEALASFGASSGTGGCN